MSMVAAGHTRHSLDSRRHARYLLFVAGAVHPTFLLSRVYTRHGASSGASRLLPKSSPVSPSARRPPRYTPALTHTQSHTITHTHTLTHTHSLTHTPSHAHPPCHLVADPHILNAQAPLIYSPPEIVVGVSAERTAPAAAAMDAWGLGALLWHMRAGDPLFSSETEACFESNGGRQM